MKISDYIAAFLKSKNVDLIFCITGSGSLRLIESAEQAGIKYVSPHHEQAGVMASLTRMRTNGKPAVMMVTGGPGASNTLIALADAYLDSLPLIVIAGQENLEYMVPKNKIRGKGVQGLDMVDITKPVTKFGACLTDPKNIKHIMEQSFFEAYNGRPGPVWIEIPQNLQWAEVDPNQMIGFYPDLSAQSTTDMTAAVSQTLDLIKNSRRPLLWVGHGIRLSGAEQQFKKLLDKLNVPALVTWQAADLVPDDHPMFVGRAGTYGQRFANLALQNCDLLIALGTRIALPQRGYNDKHFSRASKKVIVEIDPAELEKFQFNIDVPVLGNVSNFIDEMLLQTETLEMTRFDSWMLTYKTWQDKYPMAAAPKDLDAEGINSYWFIDRLSQYLEKDHLIVTDMGTSLTCTHAAIKLKQGQRIMTSTGLGEMGFGLPGAIGAALGTQSQRVVLITGEGGLMMNLQELQTMKNLKLDIKIFLINNNGYLTIKHTHNALYNSQGTAGACSPASGVTFPDFESISKAFGFNFTRIETARNLDFWIQAVLANRGPIIAEISMPEFQELIPKLAVKKREDGTVYSSPLEDLYPFLPAEELEKEMLIPLVKE